MNRFLEKIAKEAKKLSQKELATAKVNDMYKGQIGAATGNALASAHTGMATKAAYDAVKKVEATPAFKRQVAHGQRLLDATNKYKGKEADAARKRAAKLMNKKLSQHKLPARIGVALTAGFAAKAGKDAYDAHQIRKRYKEYFNKGK